MSIDWNCRAYFCNKPRSATQPYLGWLWSGFQVTVALSITAWIIAFLVGSLFGILRTVLTVFSLLSARCMWNCSGVTFR